MNSGHAHKPEVLYTRDSVDDSPPQSPNPNLRSSPDTIETPITTRESDLDDSSSDLFDDSDSEPRLADPRAYFEKLEALRAEIYNNSAVWIHGHNRGPDPQEVGEFSPAKA